MQKWEYKIINIVTDERNQRYYICEDGGKELRVDARPINFAGGAAAAFPPQITNYLNHIGGEGWEIIAAPDSSWRYAHLFLKRQISE